MISQYKVLEYFIDLVFPVHKLGIEMKMDTRIDLKLKNKKIQALIKKETGFKIIRINPGKEDFDIFDDIGKIQSSITESTKKTN